MIGIPLNAIRFSSCTVLYEVKEEAYCEVVARLAKIKLDNQA